MSYTKDTISGRFSPRNPQKYAGDFTQIIYRSSYELKFMHWCDTTPAVTVWSSEEVIVPYKSPADGRVHRYFVDFWIEVIQPNGKKKRSLIEVKPSRFVAEPKIPKRKTKRFITEVLQWGVNQAKWEAASAYAKLRGWDFLIITEKELRIVP